MTRVTSTADPLTRRAFRVRADLFDVTPVAGSCSPVTGSPRRSSPRACEVPGGPGVCKVDWALSGPVPWTAEACRRAATVHVGGTLAKSPRRSRGRAGPPSGCAVLHRRPAERRRPTRAPERTTDAMGVLPRAERLDVDMTDRIEAQIERFAPGFRDLVLAARPRRRGRGGSVTIRTTWAATSTGAPATLRQTLFRPTPDGTVPHRDPASTCARRRPRPAVASTACAVRRRRARSCRTSASLLSGVASATGPEPFVPDQAMRLRTASAGAEALFAVMVSAMTGRLAAGRGAERHQVSVWWTLP